MTRRERLERKIEKREQWAAKAEARSAQAFDSAHRIADGIPLGQPILVGHHSERRHRRDVDRIHAGMSKGCEEAALAEHHRARGGGLADQLDRSIFSDDPDAVDAIQARIRELETVRDRMKRANAVYRKGGRDALAAELGDGEVVAWDKLRGLCPYARQPYPPYALSNIGGNISRLRKRLVDVQARAARAAAADSSAGGVVIEGTWDYVRVTFAEKPAREILDAMRAADFRWGGGSWTGPRAKLPPAVVELASAPPEPPGGGA